MNEKAGRNDPCPCGSGKKYKQCCWGKAPPKRQLTAKWLNNPAMKEIPDLLARTFGDALASEKPPIPPGMKKLQQENSTTDHKPVE